ncbi:MAG: hypothetical protein KatS3mg050_2168 [Litorilinea sp.]|nr:MAG: hypothetical protein KatS3mg050_2168 [Litorilinea sp.]
MRIANVGPVPDLDAVHGQVGGVVPAVLMSEGDGVLLAEQAGALLCAGHQERVGRVGDVEDGDARPGPDGLFGVDLHHVALVHDHAGVALGGAVAGVDGADDLHDLAWVEGAGRQAGPLGHGVEAGAASQHAGGQQGSPEAEGQARG